MLFRAVDSIMRLFVYKKTVALNALIPLTIIFQRFRLAGIMVTCSVLLFEFILANGLLLHYKDASPIVLEQGG